MHHFAEAGAVLGTEKLVTYSLLAGERALTPYAWEEAVAHFGRGLGSKDSQSMDTEKAELLFGLGLAQMVTMNRTEIQQVVANLYSAFDHFIESGNVSKSIAVASAGSHDTLLTSVFMMAIRVKAFDLTIPRSVESDRLLCYTGRTSDRSLGDYQGAEESFNRALEIAQSLRDTDLGGGEVLIQLCLVESYYLNTDQGLESGLGAIELSPTGYSPYALSIALQWTAYILLQLKGKPVAAAQHGDNLLSLSQTLRD